VAHLLSVEMPDWAPSASNPCSETIVCLSLRVWLWNLCPAPNHPRYAQVLYCSNLIN
jgi:hypothetical protein